ncbi:MAG: hypothetical protein C0480_11720 [Bradyrhizobium sp.]|nr:hypothetical protein [Bradyrhizobium sp.]
MQSRAFVRLRSSIFGRKRKIMMRICLIVIGLGVLIAMELGTPSRSKPSELDPFEQLKLDASASGDTLKKGDRLEVHHLPQEAPAQPIALHETVSSPPPDLIAMLAEKNSDVVGSTPSAKKDVAKKFRPRPKDAAPSKPAAKLANSGKAAKTERKAVAELKPCRPNAFDELLQALSLSSRCQT